MESFLRKHFRKRPSFITNSAAETMVFSREFALFLSPGDMVALSGGLGAGKTHFVKGIASFFKVKKERVVSPTFNLMKEYKGKGAVIYHFDFYRLDNFDALDRIGYREYITDPGAIVLAEWPEKVRETWNDFNWVVKIGHAGGNKRKITVYHKA
jgi:tRNA threonylcarbamoyladenosine biosynthesis protein TsaE